MAEGIQRRPASGAAPVNAAAEAADAGGAGKGSGVAVGEAIQTMDEVKGAPCRLPPQSPPRREGARPSRSYPISL